jgi:hypothetical protein
MITYEAIGGLVLIVALVVFAMWCCYRAGLDTGYEQGRGDRHEADLAESRRGRHAKSQPRTSSPAPAAVVPEPRTSLARSGYRDSWFTAGPVELPSGGAIGVFLNRANPAVTAADISTVLLPPAPAPDLNGADDTGTLLKVGDTGEMKAITDKWIAEHIHPEVVV